LTASEISNALERKGVRLELIEKKVGNKVEKRHTERERRISLISLWRGKGV
jgi:hypothetical protein